MTADLRGYMAIEDRADQQEDRRFHLGVRGGACSPFGPGEALLTLVRPSDLCRFCPHALNKAAPAMGPNDLVICALPIWRAKYVRR